LRAVLLGLAFAVLTIVLSLVLPEDRESLRYSSKGRRRLPERPTRTGARAVV
jgi:hypothetical protein